MAGSIPASWLFPAVIVVWAAILGWSPGLTLIAVAAIALALETQGASAGHPREGR